MNACSLGRKTLWGRTDGVEPFLSASIIQMGTRCSTDTDSSDHFSADFDGQSSS
jgi:hypothetical protein